MNKAKQPRKVTKKQKEIPPSDDEFEDVSDNEEEKTNEPTLYDLLNIPKNATTEEIVIQ